jgi:hypothetical protein
MAMKKEELENGPDAIAEKGAAGHRDHPTVYQKRVATMLKETIWLGLPIVAYSGAYLAVPEMGYSTSLLFFLLMFSIAQFLLAKKEYGGSEKPETR